MLLGDFAPWRERFFDSGGAEYPLRLAHASVFLPSVAVGHVWFMRGSKLLQKAQIAAHKVTNIVDGVAHHHQAREP
jgi:hypothetical protein